MSYFGEVTSNDRIPGLGQKQFFWIGNCSGTPSNLTQLHITTHLGLQANTLMGQSWSGSPDARLGHWVLIIAKQGS